MKTKTNVSVDVLNRIRESASVNYQTAVPIATPNADNIRDIGSILIDSPNLQNEFLNALINRIGKVVIKTRLFENPLKPFNKGLLEYGETVEEVFVNLCAANQYDADKSEDTVWKREFPDVKSQFHTVNSEIFYKQSVGRRELEKAFLSSEGVYDLVEYIIQKMYVSANYDEFLVMKYLIAKAALDGTTAIYPVTAVTDEATAKGLLKAIKKTSNDFEILSQDFNTAGVYNSSDKNEQYLIIDNANDANLSVDALAYMFGPAFVSNDAKKIRIDGFDKLDVDRLKKVLGINEDPFTETEVSALGNIEAVLLDWAWFQIYYKLFETRFLENPENLYENTWLHTWKIYSRSIFENCVIFASGTNGVSSVEINSASVPTVNAGVAGKKELTVDIAFTGLTPIKGGVVEFAVETSSTNGVATIDSNGVLTWNDGFATGDTITVIATSAIDSSKTDSVTITVAS